MAPLFEDRLASLADTAARSARLPSSDATRRSGDRRRRRKSAGVALVTVSVVGIIAVAGWGRLDNEQKAGPIAPAPATSVSPTLPAVTSPITSPTTASPVVATTGATSSSTTTRSPGAPLTGLPGDLRAFALTTTLPGGGPATLAIAKSGRLAALPTPALDRTLLTVIPVSPGSHTVELVTTRLMLGSEGFCLEARSSGLSIQACDTRIRAQRFEFSAAAGPGGLRLHNQNGYVTVGVDGSVALSPSTWAVLQMVDHGAYTYRVGD